MVISWLSKNHSDCGVFFLRQHIWRHPFIGILLWQAVYNRVCGVAVLDIWSAKPIIWKICLWRIRLCRFTNISVRPAVTALKSLCCLPVIRTPNVLNANAGMSKSWCRRVVCGPRELPPVPAALMARPASPPAEGSSQSLPGPGRKKWFYSGCQKNVSVFERFFLQPLMPRFLNSEQNYEKR